jgi:alkylation response protein AidB-like acyl-CoA dehydrogenase
MNFELDDAQVMLKTAARDFLEKECTKKLVRSMMEDEKGYSLELWKAIADLGWLGLTFPQDYGGEGSAFLDLAVLLEECGRALMPGPLLPTVVLGGRSILAAGTNEQKEFFLPRIAAGDMILTMGLLEAGAGIEASDVGVTAIQSGHGFCITGTKLFVPDAHVADYIVCVTRTGEPVDNEGGITLFLVDARTEGVQVEVLKTMSGQKLCEVRFDDVVVPRENMLGQLDLGWTVVKRALLEAQLAESAYMVGGARWVMDTSIEYAKGRIAFGRPIGSFQAIQHKLANMAVEVEGATSILYYGAWTIMENDPDMELAVSMAKAWCSETFKHAAFDGVQIHGGIGYTWDHDMHLYLKRAKAGEVTFGDPDYHREKVARLLGV